MADWAGFTDADIRKLKVDKPKNEGARSGRPAQQPRQTAQQPRQQNKAAQQKRPMVAKSIGKPTTEQLDDSMRLSRPVEKKQSPPAEERKHTGTGKPGTASNSQPHTGSHGHPPDVTTDPPTGGSIEPTENVVDEVTNADDIVTDDQEIFEHEKHNMESFQKQQKMIEERNKMKKQMLTQAIKERSKKAKAESAKLLELQSELAKLDQRLTIDVSIIRNKIEESCREYLEAQRRYDRAEKEFIESKIDLHKKLEGKESLTEHLYTVIYQNEMRKSKKLAELMTKLEMEIEADGPEIIECEMPHPSLISPVQLPAGRYGQIGPLRSPSSNPAEPELSTEKPDETQASPDAKSDGASAEADKEKKEPQKESTDKKETENKAESDKVVDVTEESKDAKSSDVNQNETKVEESSES